jgi:hypothetical protein
MGGLKIGSEGPGQARPRTEATPTPDECDHWIVEGEVVEKRDHPRENICGGKLSPEGKPREGVPGKKEVCSEWDSGGTTGGGLPASRMNLEVGALEANGKPKG